VNHVRALLAHDIPALAELHASVFWEVKRCIFHGGGAPLLFYSRQHDLIEAVRAGDAFLTRLDGEWWMPFQRPARARASA
jgi:hypothetical protein